MRERPTESRYAQRDYDSEDLQTFKHVVRGVIGSLRSKRSPLAEPNQLEVTIIRATAAIFELADEGVRDPTRLQKHAEARLSEPLDGPTMAYMHGGRATRH